MWPATAAFLAFTWLELVFTGSGEPRVLAWAALGYTVYVLAWTARRIARETGMPVVASGGYYIAMGADKILAHPSCLTGSIGVIIQSWNGTGLFETIAVRDGRCRFWSEHMARLLSSCECLRIAPPTAAFTITTWKKPMGSRSAISKTISISMSLTCIRLTTDRS